MSRRHNSQQPELGSTTSSFSVAIIGGGLVGCLNAVYFARRGWNVDIYERREGILNDFFYIKSYLKGFTATVSESRSYPHG